MRTHRRAMAMFGAIRLCAPLWKSPLNHLAGHFANGLARFVAELKILGTGRDSVPGCPSNVFENRGSNVGTDDHRTSHGHTFKDHGRCGKRCCVSYQLSRQESWFNIQCGLNVECPSTASRVLCHSHSWWCYFAGLGNLYEGT